MIDLTSIGTIISALTTLLVAAGSILLQRQRRSALDADELEDELDVRTRQYQAAVRHARNLEDDRASRGLAPLPLPAELRPGYFRQQQARGRRQRRAWTDPDAELGPGEGDAEPDGAA